MKNKKARSGVSEEPARMKGAEFRGLADLPKEPEANGFAADRSSDMWGVDEETAVASGSGTAAAKRKAKLRPKSLDKKKARMGYVFVLPFVLGFFIIYLPMIVDSLHLSFSEISMEGFSPTYKNVGIENYRYALFEDTNFVKTLLTNLKSLLLDIPAIVIFSLFLAIILNQKMHGRALFRAIFFIPVIVSTGIIEYIDMKNVLATTMGSTSLGGDTGQAVKTGTEIIGAIDVRKFFASMQVGQDLVNYVTNLVNNVYSIVNRSGVQMLIFLAGLQSISPAIYESAYMEGATSWETFWKITFPMISPMILVNTIYTIIDSFTTETNRVMQKISEVDGSSMTHAMAMSWIYFVVVILLLALVAGIISLYVFYQRRD